MTKVSFFLINDKQGGVCSHTLLCDYHELLEDLLHFFFQPVHMPVNRLFGNLQIPGYFMSAIPLDLHQNDLKGKPVHGDQHMIQFLILNTIQKVLYCFQFCLICGCCYGIQTQPLSTIPLKMEEALPESLHLLVISLEISLVRLGSSSKICLNNRSLTYRGAADFVVLS